MQAWYSAGLEGDRHLILEVVPAFGSISVIEFRVKSHHIIDNGYMVAADGTETLTGTLFDRVVFANGVGSAVVVGTGGERVAIYFNIHYLALYSECMKRVGDLGNTPNLAGT